MAVLSITIIGLSRMMNSSQNPLESSDLLDRQLTPDSMDMVQNSSTPNGDPHTADTDRLDPSLYLDSSLTEETTAEGSTDSHPLNYEHGKAINHYILHERLGGGIMSAVYRATDQILEQDIALKILLPGADSVTRERFLREARTVSTLMHPHIVPTLQVGQTGPDGITYIAMELVTGNSLGDLLERHPQLSVVDTCSLLEPIVRALDYAHAKGIVHRDVKPSNILIRRVAPGTPGGVQLAPYEYPVVPLLSDLALRGH